MSRDPFSLPGYDAWKTQTPEEYYNTPEQDIRYRLEVYSPRMEDASLDFDFKEDAQATGETWLALSKKADPEYADDYYFEVVEYDANADCTCSYRKRDKWCPVHGQDPDQGRDR